MRLPSSHRFLNPVVVVMGNMAPVVSCVRHRDTQNFCSHPQPHTLSLASSQVQEKENLFLKSPKGSHRCQEDRSQESYGAEDRPCWQYQDRKRGSKTGTEDEGLFLPSSHLGEGTT